MYVWMLPVCLGILNLFPLNYVSGRVFQAQSKVIWSDAEIACQQAKGTLFMPDKGSFDMQLFENQGLDGDSWVAATYTFVSDPETSFRMIEPDARDRCIAFEIGQDCTGHYWHKSCNETYSIICESYPAPDRQWILGSDMTWIVASDLCQSRSLKMATFITNTRQFFDQGPCEPGFHWTGRVIEVAFQSNTEPTYSQGACGFLQNHILSFGNCSRMIRPLCITAEETISGTNSLQHDNRTSIPLNGESFSSSTESDWITQITSTNSDITRTTSKGHHTTYSLSYGFSVENVSSSLSTDMEMERDIDSISFQDEALHLSDIGVIIGSVLGGAVFMFLIVLLVIILRKRLERGKARIDAPKEMTPKTLRLNKIKNPTLAVDDPGMVVLQYGSGNAGNAADTSNPEGRNGDLLEEISKQNNSVNVPMDIKVDDHNYSQIKTEIITPNRYDSIHLDDDSYDHVEYENKAGSGKVTIHVYDKANFHLRQESLVQGSFVCDTTGECNTRVDKHDGEYDKANHRLFGDYNTNHVIASEKDSTSYHV